MCKPSIYLNSFTCSIFLLPSSTHSFHSSSFSYLTPSFSSFQKTLPAFSSSHTFPDSSSFLSFLFHSLPQISSPQTIGFKFSLYLPHSFFNISSISVTYIVNSRGLSGQLCLTAIFVSNHSPSLYPTFTLFFVIAYISSIFRTSHLLIRLCLSLMHANIFLCLPCQTSP
jgi:hypothetical protein